MGSIMVRRGSLMFSFCPHPIYVLILSRHVQDVHDRICSFLNKCWFYTWTSRLRYKSEPANAERFRFHISTHGCENRRAGFQQNKMWSRHYVIVNTTSYISRFWNKLEPRGSPYLFSRRIFFFPRDSHGRLLGIFFTHFCSISVLHEINYLVLI